jgi:ribonuclease P protein component
MKRAARLKRRVDFDRVMADGRRVNGAEFVLYHARRDDPGPPRVGFSVGRRVGNAVTRNRVRRLLREAVRRLVPRLESCDIVVSARPEIVAVGLRELESGLSDAAVRAGLIRSDSGSASSP